MGFEDFERNNEASFEEKLAKYRGGAGAGNQSGFPNNDLGGGSPQGGGFEDFGNQNQNWGQPSGNWQQPNNGFNNQNQNWGQQSPNGFGNQNQNWQQANQPFPNQQPNGAPAGGGQQPPSDDDGRLSLGKRILIFVLVFVIFAGGIFFIIKVTTSLTGGKSQDPKVETSQVQEREQKKVEEVPESSTKTETTTSDASSDNIQSVPSAEPPAQPELDVTKLKPEVLKNTAQVKSISLVSENDLLAVFKVSFKMGSTNLDLVLNYDQAQGLSVGDEVTINYSIVDGADRVVVRSIER